MSALRKGDRVRVVIEDAEVEITADDRITIQTPGSPMGYINIHTNHPGVTVTKIAPQPQAGQVWEHPELGKVYIHEMGTSDEVQSLIARPPTGRGSRLVTSVDWSGARCVYPLPDAAPAPVLAADAEQAGKLRQKGDVRGRTWTETAPDSGRYVTDGDGPSDLYTVDHYWGPLADLPAVAADEVTSAAVDQAA